MTDRSEYLARAIALVNKANADNPDSPVGFDIHAIANLLMTADIYAPAAQVMLDPVTRGALVGPAFPVMSMSMKLTRDELKALYPHPDDLPIEVKRVHPTGCPCAGCTTPRGGFEFL